jgi:hypothetical protein
MFKIEEGEPFTPVLAAPGFTPPAPPPPTAISYFPAAKVIAVPLKGLGPKPEAL